MITPTVRSLIAETKEELSFHTSQVLHLQGQLKRLEEIQSHEQTRTPYKAPVNNLSGLTTASLPLIPKPARKRRGRKTKNKTALAPSVADTMGSTQNAVATVHVVPGAKPKKQKRILTPEAREAISSAAKKRHAKNRREKQKAAKQAQQLADSPALVNGLSNQIDYEPELAQR